MARRTLAIFPLALAAVLAAACGSDDGTAAPVAPAAGGAADAVGAPIPGGGLTVSEALASDLVGPLQVHGPLLVEGERMTLCERLEESDPPGCAGATVEVRGLDAGQLELQGDGDVRWTDDVSVLGSVDGGTLTVSRTSS